MIQNIDQIITQLSTQCDISVSRTQERYAAESSFVYMFVLLTLKLDVGVTQRRVHLQDVLFEYLDMTLILVAASRAMMCRGMPLV